MAEDKDERPILVVIKGLIRCLVFIFIAGVVIMLLRWVGCEGFDFPLGSFRE